MILVNQKLELKNVLSYRGVMNTEEINQKLFILEKFIKDNNLKKGYMITTTYSMELVDGQQKLDIEILCSVEQLKSIPDDFMLKPIFRLTNALKISHYGNPALLQNRAQQLIEYANTKCYTPITSIYNVTVVEPKSKEDIENMQIDLYLGVSDNIL